MNFLRIVIALYPMLAHDLFRKPVSTFRDHALGGRELDAAPHPLPMFRLLATMALRKDWNPAPPNWPAKFDGQLLKARRSMSSKSVPIRRYGLNHGVNRSVLRLRGP